MSKFSVIIVNYNGQRFLQRLLDSIQNQTFEDFEVIFVDNGSKDDSINFVKENFPDVKTIQLENKGYGTGCNTGAKIARGEFLIFLNEDMYLPEDFLEKMIAFRESLPDQGKIGAISCKMVDFEAKPDNFKPTYGAKIDVFGFPVRAKNSEETFVVSGSPMFIRKDLFLKIHGFNEAIFIYGEDVDLSWRLNIFGFRNYTVNSTYLHHFGGGATGILAPKKVADIVYGAFIPIFTNYSLVALLLILPAFLVFIICFYIILSIAKFDFGYIFEMFRKIGFFKQNLKRALLMRHFVQTNRKKNDLYLKKYISPLPAFVVNRSLEKLREGYAIKNF